MDTDIRTLIRLIKTILYLAHTISATKTHTDNTQVLLWMMLFASTLIKVFQSNDWAEESGQFLYLKLYNSIRIYYFIAHYINFSEKFIFSICHQSEHFFSLHSIQSNIIKYPFNLYKFIEKEWCKSKAGLS